MTPRVLVLLAAHNGVRWIEEQVESVLAQRGVEVMLVVGDDASTDDTRMRLAARWGQDARVRVISYDVSSGSAGASFQRLMRDVDSSSFDVVALADQDDRWYPDKLRAACEILESSGAAGYSAAVRAHWSDGRQALLSQSPRTRRADFLFEGAGQGCTFAMRRDFFQRVQLFLRSGAGSLVGLHFHDWMLYALCRAWSLRWVFDPVPRMDYRQHDGNDIGARGRIGGFRRRIKMIRNGWYSEQIRLVSRLYEEAGGQDPVALDMAGGLQRRSTRGLAASTLLAFRLLAAGRRRPIDRSVLFIAALAGWI